MQHLTTRTCYYKSVESIQHLATLTCYYNSVQTMQKDHSYLLLQECRVNAVLGHSYLSLSCLGERSCSFNLTLCNTSLSVFLPFSKMILVLVYIITFQKLQLFMGSCRRLTFKIHNLNNSIRRNVDRVVMLQKGQSKDVLIVKQISIFSRPYSPSHPHPGPRIHFFFRFVFPSYFLTSLCSSARFLFFLISAVRSSEFFIRRIVRLC